MQTIKQTVTVQLTHIFGSAITSPASKIQSSVRTQPIFIVKSIPFAVHTISVILILVPNMKLYK